MRFRSIIFFFLALTFAAGCGTHAPKAEKVRVGKTTDWGYYSGPVDARWDADGRGMTLLNELRYTDPKGDVWIAPAGAKVDGASIPRSLWSLMGGPFEGKYRNASVLHDVAYTDKSRPWQEADRMFYNAMRCSGVGVIEAKTMYYSLCRFGWHWKFRSKRAQPVNVDSPASVLAERPRATAITPQDVNAMQEWVRSNDPNLNQIEARAGSESH
jgi:Protein of unknown function (DUF1353)